MTVCLAFVARGASCSHDLRRLDDGIITTAADEANLKDAVANVGPISIAVDASIGWQLYGGGVMKPGKLLGCKADPAKMDHGVAAVGYGTDGGTDYWIVRNSWGEDWGMNGYILMTRNGDNQCGVACDATYAIIG